MHSPGHRANILDAHFRDTGIGVSPHPHGLAHGQAAASTRRTSASSSAEQTGWPTDGAQPAVPEVHAAAPAGDGG